VAKNKALGRGLSALIGENATGKGKAGEGRLRELRIADIGVSRRQPRRNFDEVELQELAQSI
jgi:hypothetical protein